MKKSTIFIIIGIVLALCLIIAPVSASTITTLAQLQSACTAGGTHELGANISGVAINITKTMTLDLKTYTLTGTGSSSVIKMSTNDVTFNLYGTTGKITGGSAYGGGVSLGGSSIFNMYGGNITGNNAPWGGGIYLGGTERRQPKAHIYGGSITGNTATSGGGGIYTVYGNVYFSGKPVVKDNIANNAVSNVANQYGYLRLEGNLESGAEVHVHSYMSIGAKFGETLSTSYTGAERFISDSTPPYSGYISGTNLIWGTYVPPVPPLSLDNFTINPASSSYLPTNKSVTLTATISGGTSPFSYVWSYTTTPNPTASSSWTNIGTTSANSTTYTPTSAGTYTFRVVVSAGSTSEDSLNKSLKPYLNIFVALNGGGTSSSPYQVGSNSDLQNWNTYATYYNDKYMTITQDFVPATTVSAFAGNLAGGNHTLINARLPLFNTLEGTVNNLKFTNSIVSGNGILANTSSAAISNVTADDCFVGGSTTGGLVGNATGSFTDCTVNHITVKGSSTAGGIAGAGNTTVTRCKVLNTDLLAPTTYGVCA